jgi:cytoskeletal protein CcmA (bactofilin family)
MEGNRDPDLILNGVGGACGGRYRHVKIEGVGRVNGSLQCGDFVLQGVGTIRGDVSCTDRFEVRGKLTAEGGVEAAHITVEGQAHWKGRLRGGHVKLEGLVKVDGDCEADFLVIEGGVTVEGLLNAEEIGIRMQGRVQAKEIGGRHIRVGRSRRSNWSRLLGWMLPVLKPQLHAGVIEGDDVELSWTTADVVRGNRVVIGPGCRIGSVEYGTGLTVHPDARVDQRIQR